MIASDALRAFVLAAALSGCPDPAPQNVALRPEGEQVLLVSREPNPILYDEVGEIRASAMGHNVDDATQSARFELRNKAAMQGVTHVLVERNEGEPGGLRERIKITLIGRAFRPKDRVVPEPSPSASADPYERRTVAPPGSVTTVAPQPAPSLTPSASAGGAARPVPSSRPR